MKISNSKKELARIISENGGWREVAEWAAQDSKIDQFPFRVCFYQNRPTIEKGDTKWIDGNCRPIVDSVDASRQIKNWHQTILARVEYFHLYPAPDADGWIEWKGGECPVEKGTLVDVIWRDGTERAGVEALQLGGAGHQFWVADGMVNDIIAYRLHKPEQAKPEFCESVLRSIPEPEIHSKNTALTHVNDTNVVELKPTIEQLAADYRNAKDYALRLQEEANNAWNAAEKAKGELIDAGKSIGIDIHPITAKPQPELVITDWWDLKVGDEISVQHMKNVYSKSEVLVVGDSEVAVRNHSGARKTVNLDAVDWKFIRRP